MARKIDYHVHTRFSDGYNSPQEMLLAAKDKNLQELCITDHYSTMKPALSEFEIEGYFTSLDQMKKNNSTRVDLFIGIEVDIYSITSFEELEKYNWDLVLFEYVFHLPSWQDNFRKVLRFKKNFPNTNVGLAHTRFSRVSEAKLDYVLAKLKDYQIIIELNTSYQNYLDSWFNYLNEDFWYSIGTDAHSMERLGGIGPALDYLKNRQIPENKIIKL